MIGLAENVSIYLCTTPVDSRKEVDGLTGIVTTEMNHQVTDGSLFLFVNRKRLPKCTAAAGQNASLILSRQIALVVRISGSTSFIRLWGPG